MKPLKTLCIIASLLLFSCTPQTTVDDVPDHQPANPKTWSPAGKVYLCDRSEDFPPFCVEVLDFFSADSMVMYASNNSDFTPIDHSYQPCYYQLEYPTLIIGWGNVEKRYFTIIDTTTIYSKAWELYFILK